jgi:hypothetical protein
MWKFEFEQPAGARILSGRFFGVCHFDDKADLWWGEDERRWAPFDELHNMDVCCTHAPVRSFKAFKRHLRKHPELKKVEEVILVSRFIGYNIKARWVDE